MFFIVCFELDSRSFLDVARRYSFDNRQSIDSLVVKCRVDISAPRARNIVKNQNISYRPKVQELVELLGLDCRGKIAFERLFLGSGILTNVKAYLIQKICEKLGSPGSLQRSRSRKSASKACLHCRFCCEARTTPAPPASRRQPSPPGTKTNQDSPKRSWECSRTNS